MSTLQSVTVDLDMRMPLEALILQRLRRLPVCRHKEWVRQLVLVGFRNECQTMKAEHVNGSFTGVDGHMKSFSMPHPVQSKDDSVPVSSASSAQAARHRLRSNRARHSVPQKILQITRQNLLRISNA